MNENTYITRNQLFDVVLPLILALHEKKIIDIAEVPHLYEDVLVRRKLNLGASDDDLAFLQWLIDASQLLANAIKGPK